MLKRTLHSFGFAINGIRIGFRDETNFQIQVAMALASIILGVYFQVSIAEWLFVFGAIGLVLTAELLNTALEELCDMLKDTHDPAVAKIKDLAAGAVLCASLCALVIGLIIFLPKFFAL
jgi:diacylglycerol kinase